MFSQSQETQPLDIHHNDHGFRNMKMFSNWIEVEQMLSNMASLKYNAAEILQALKKFKQISIKDRNPAHLPKKFSFNALLKLYRQELPAIYSLIANYTLKNLHHSHPFFPRQVAQSHTFSHSAILFLICSMSLFLIPKQQHETASSKQPSGYNYQNDFSLIFQHSQFKTKGVIEYLKESLKLFNVKKEQSYLTIKRHIVKDKLQDIIAKYGRERMCPIKIAGDNQSIEDYFGCVKVDFANKFVGGGALSSGCVQEQIMFANHPALYATILLCPQLAPNQALHLTGFKKYHCNSGYGPSTAYSRPQLHLYSYDSFHRAKQYITVMDALIVNRNCGQQFSRQNVKRQILKAFTGFSFDVQDNRQIVTGNWGCGAFGGDVRTKLLIQWVACSLAGKQLVYCPFGFRQKCFNKSLLSKLSTLTIEQAYKILLQSSKRSLKESYFKPVSQINIYRQMTELIECQEVEQECEESKRLRETSHDQKDRLQKPQLLVIDLDQGQ